MAEEDALGHNNALQRERRGESLNLFNDALYIAFLRQEDHHNATVTDFILLTTGMHNHIS